MIIPQNVLPSIQICLGSAITILCINQNWYGHGGHDLRKRGKSDSILPVCYNAGVVGLLVMVNPLIALPYKAFLFAKSSDDGRTQQCLIKVGIYRWTADRLQALQLAGRRHVKSLKQRADNKWDYNSKQHVNKVELHVQRMAWAQIAPKHEWQSHEGSLVGCSKH